LRLAYPVILICLAILLSPQMSEALPDIEQQSVIDDVRVMKDRDLPATYYVVPNGLRLALANDNHPLLTLRVARYSGSRVREDSGLVEILSVLRVGVELDEPSTEQFQATKASLESQLGGPVELRRLPLSHMQAELVMNEIEETGPQPPELEVLRKYHEQSAETQITALWQRRDIVMGLAPLTAELTERMLQDGSGGLSLSWSLSALVEGAPRAITETQYTRTGDTSDESSAMLDPDEFEDVLDGILPDSEPQEQVVLAGTIPLVLEDEAKASRLIRYDIDALLPPSYPSLAAYCFDFDNNLREDLFERQVEIEASGIAGGTTRTFVNFSSQRPQDYAATVRFRFPVDLRQPYRWRPVDTLLTGEVIVGDWRESDAWTAIIDATSVIPNSSFEEQETL